MAEIINIFDKKDDNEFEKTIIKCNETMNDSNCEDWDNFKSKKIDEEEMIDVINEFISYTDDCDYSTIDLAHYLKYELGIDCLKVYGDLSDETGISEEEYYNFLFNNPSLKEQKILMKFKRVIFDYLKNNKFPDPYIQTKKITTNY